MDPSRSHKVPRPRLVQHSSSDTADSDESLLRVCSDDSHKVWGESKSTVTRVPVTTVTDGVIGSVTGSGTLTVMDGSSNSVVAGDTISTLTLTYTAATDITDRKFGDCGAT